MFRPPPYNLSFSTLVGTGYQVLFVATIVIVFALWGDKSFGRGSLVTVVIFVYAGCAPIAGYFGGGLYARNAGEQWIKQVLATATLLPAVVCGTALLVNFIAMYYHASRAIPFRTMVRSHHILFVACFK